MRLVKWRDNHGKLKASWVRNEDLDEMAPMGVPVCTIDLNRIDWEGIKTEIEEQLVQRDLFTWQDVKAQQKGVTAICSSVIKRRIVALFRELEREQKDEAQTSAPNLPSN